MAQPNILMIMADQLPAWALGTYGHPGIQTPHIDRLASRGAVFTSAYTNCPICAPSRASMCAGRYVSAIGAFDNGADFPSSTPTFMHHLRRAGYEVLLSGKMHFLGPDQMHGFERRLTPEIYPSSFVWTPDWTKGPVPNPGTSVSQLKTAGLCRWSLQMDYDEEVHFRALEALRGLARKRREPNARPFFLCASYTHPHDPFITTEQWWSRYDHERIAMPAAPPVPLEEMHPYDRWLQIHHMVDVYPPTEEQVRNARHAFYGMVTYFDSKVGALLAELERLGLSEDTVVIVTSDHGEMLGEHGMWFKRTYFDPSTRVPLIVAGARATGGGLRVNETVSLVDLFPTLLEFAELPDREEAEADLDGDSLCGLLRGEARGWKNFALAEYYSEGVVQPMRMAVRDGLKYVYVHNAEPLLFDLAADPSERSNRFGDERYRARREELERIVHEGWDAEEMRGRVIASQRSRAYINEALGVGRAQAWDVQPHFDASRQYVRKQDSQATNARMRYP